MKWLIVSVIVFALGFFNVFAPIRGGVQYIFNPIQYGIQKMSADIKDWANFYTGLNEVRNENLALLEENENLYSQLVELKNLKKENKILKEQLGVTTGEVEQQLDLVKVLGNVEDKTATSLFINKGSYHGVSVDDILIKEKYLIGIVKTVYQFRSKVELITSPTVSVSVTDLQTGTEGIAVGQFGTSLFVNRVLPEDKVNVDDVFISSGRDGIVPQGYIVGKVSEVSENSAKVLRTVSLDLLIDFNNVSKAFVLLRNNKEK